MLPCPFPCQEVNRPLYIPLTETQSMRRLQHIVDDKDEEPPGSISNRNKADKRGRSRSSSRAQKLPAPLRVPVKAEGEQHENLPAPSRVPVKASDSDKNKAENMHNHPSSSRQVPQRSSQIELLEYTEWRNHKEVKAAIKAAREGGPWLCGIQSHTPTLSESSSARSEATTIEAVVIDDTQDAGGPEDSQCLDF